MEVNDDSICCRNLLTNDFSIFSKTEHAFEIFDIKKVLKICLKDVIEETEVSKEKYKEYLFVLDTENFNL